MNHDNDTTHTDRAVHQQEALANFLRGEWQAHSVRAYHEAGGLARLVYVPWRRLEQPFHSGREYKRANEAIGAFLSL